MNRRESIQTLLTATGAGGLIWNLSANDATNTELDHYGGWKGKSFEATGFFRVEKDDRWWLVTPEGNAFLSFGINHLYPDLFRQRFNKEAWQKRLGVSDLNENSTFNPALRNWFLQTCRDYGFNTVGVHNALQIVNRPKPAVPYMQPIKFIDVPHWKKRRSRRKFSRCILTGVCGSLRKSCSQICGPFERRPFSHWLLDDRLSSFYGRGLQGAAGCHWGCPPWSSGWVASPSSKSGQRCAGKKSLRPGNA